MKTLHKHSISIMTMLLAVNWTVVGDIFSCHAVDNPDTQSEMAMLQQYGPHVPKETLQRLVFAFSELRAMADQGLISYPYSTREVVNMVKHLEVRYTVLFCYRTCIWNSKPMLRTHY